ncbi:MAG: PilT/PilU family type 4a pilus ATPase [Gammaproteobacteria bacterium]|nr:PilT/PilU family type 4a pilus ATPase [Gammaproteobacteria bacterium]
MDLLSKLLKEMINTGASDLFLSTGSAPAFRINGKLRPVNIPPLASGRTEQMAHLIMQKEQLAVFDENPEANIGCTIPGIGRFRFNIFKQRNEIAMVVRAVPSSVPDFETLGIPSMLRDIVMMKRGLVLVVGPSGAGKSTTLASMINYRNHNDISHIITIEDPIEYIIEHKRSIVNQRELGVDTNSYHNALMNALRQSPDVIMVGEIRDREMMENVLEFSDTGHLCLATLHSNNAAQAFDRIVHMFPKDKHEQLCIGLSHNIKAVVSQILVPTTNGKRTVATELLINTPRIADLIARGQFGELHDVLEKDTNSGMCTMDQSLYHLFCHGRITEETALVYANSVSNMRLQIRLSGQGSSNRKKPKPEKVEDSAANAGTN